MHYIHITDMRIYVKVGLCFLASMYLSMYLFVYLSNDPSIYRIYRSLHLHVHVHVHLYVCICISYTCTCTCTYTYTHWCHDEAFFHSLKAFKRHCCPLSRFFGHGGLPRGIPTPTAWGTFIPTHWLQERSLHLCIRLEGSG